jgi:protein O-mannosyl-transferase
MTICPVQQSLDHDYPTSHTITEHYALVYLILLLALIAAAVIWRRRYPLASLGFLMYLIWLAPTSSVIPLDDALVERRMYLPVMALLLVGCEVWSRLAPPPAVAYSILMAMGLFYGKLCYDRNQLWGDPDKLEEAAAAQAVDNPRPLLNVTGIFIQEGRCTMAIPYLQRAEKKLPNNYYVNAAWGRTLACLGQYDAAMARLQQARKLHAGPQIYEWIGLLYGQMELTQAAGEALQKAVELGPESESAHGSLAMWYEKNNQPALAEQEYRRALAIEESDSWAQNGLLRVSQRSAGH